MVFDASSKNKYSKSLNECLFAGPSLTPSLYGVLTRFRAFNYALVANIEKAFLQISIHPSLKKNFYDSFGLRTLTILITKILKKIS